MSTNSVFGRTENKTPLVMTAWGIQLSAQQRNLACSPCKFPRSLNGTARSGSHHL